MDYPLGNDSDVSDEVLDDDDLEDAGRGRNSNQHDAPTPPAGTATELARLDLERKRLELERERLELEKARAALKEGPEPSGGRRAKKETQKRKSKPERTRSRPSRAAPARSPSRSVASSSSSSGGLGAAPFAVGGLVVFAVLMFLVGSGGGNKRSSPEADPDAVAVAPDRTRSGTRREQPPARRVDQSQLGGWDKTTGQDRPAPPPADEEAPPENERTIEQAHALRKQLNGCTAEDYERISFELMVMAKERDLGPATRAAIERAVAKAREKKPDLVRYEARRAARLAEEEKFQEAFELAVLLAELAPDHEDLIGEDTLAEWQDKADEQEGALAAAQVDAPADEPPPEQPPQGGEEEGGTVPKAPVQPGVSGDLASAGDDSEHPAAKSLLKRVELMLERREKDEILCKTCRGLRIVKCSMCGGSGKVRVFDMALGRYVIQTCRRCRGGGLLRCGDDLDVLGYRALSIRRGLWDFLTPTARKKLDRRQFYRDSINETAHDLHVGYHPAIVRSNVTKVQLFSHSALVTVNVTFLHGFTPTGLMIQDDPILWVSEWIKARGKWYLRSTYDEELEPVAEGKPETPETLNHVGKAAHDKDSGGGADDLPR